MKTYIPPQEELKRIIDLKKNEKHTIFIPLKKQPPKETTHWHTNYRNALFYSNDIETIYSIPIQFPKGETVGIPESWGWDMDEGYVYLQDDLPENTPHGKEFYNSPATMPHEAIRTFRTVTGNRVCRVQAVTIGEWNKIERAYADPKKAFNSQFANKRRKNKSTWEDNPYGELVTLEKK